MVAELGPDFVTARTATDYVSQLGLRPADVGDRLAQLRSAVTGAVEAVEEAVAAGQPVYPEVDAADVVAGAVPAATVAAVHRTGCVIVRGTFARAEAEAWDAEIADYVARNSFRERFEEHNAAAATGSRIWGVYWSRPQVHARQHPRMDAVRRFLNRMWSYDSPGGPWFDPDVDIGYPDRVRRREPGATSRGLAMHVDTPAAGGWRIAENRRVFAPLLAQGIDAHDPWDAAHRTGADVESPVGCSVFRTFQGWTALSEMHPTDGVLHVVPIPLAVAYRFVVGLAGELGVGGADEEPAPRRDPGDALLVRALAPIPCVAPGDTVWWHGDLYHSVADATNDTRWSNVMYIGVAPWCPRNERYRDDAYDRFASGASPRDFPPEDFEIDFEGRASPDDLTPLGRAQFGLVV